MRPTEELENKMKAVLDIIAGYDKLGSPEGWHFRSFWKMGEHSISYEANTQHLQPENTDGTIPIIFSFEGKTDNSDWLVAIKHSHALDPEYLKDTDRYNDFIRQFVYQVKSLLIRNGLLHTFEDRLRREQQAKQQS